MINDISLIGAGNLATSIATALHKCGINIKQIYSRTMQSAKLLADMTDSTPVDKLEHLEEADLFIVSLKDSVMDNILKQLPAKIKGSIFVHTSGSSSIDIWKGKDIDRYGVIYPLQTFTKKRIISFQDIPVLLEANNSDVLEELKNIARMISDNVYEYSSAQRETIHLAAVFACNFSNHMYAIASHILEQNNMDIKLLYPLIEETTEKIKSMPPTKAQTGPAARNDSNIIDKQMHMLEKEDDLKFIYEIMTKHIQQWER